MQTFLNTYKYINIQIYRNTLLPGSFFLMCTFTRFSQGYILIMLLPNENANHPRHRYHTSSHHSPLYIGVAGKMSAENKQIFLRIFSTPVWKICERISSSIEEERNSLRSSTSFVIRTQLSNSFKADSIS